MPTSPMKEKIEKLLEEICEDTGLSKSWLRNKATLEGLKLISEDGVLVKVTDKQEGLEEVA